MLENDQSAALANECTIAVVGAENDAFHFLVPHPRRFFVVVVVQGEAAGSSLAFAVMVGTVQSILSKATKVQQRPSMMSISTAVIF